MPRPTRLIPIGGELVPLALVAKRAGMSATAFRSRLDRGWPLAEALATPHRCQRRDYGRLPVPRPVPTLREQKARGYAFVSWSVNGKRYYRYMGKAGSERAARLYRRFCRTWERQFRPTPKPPAASNGWPGTSPQRFPKRPPAHPSAHPHPAGYAPGVWRNSG